MIEVVPDGRQGRGAGRGRGGPASAPDFQQQIGGVQQLAFFRRGQRPLDRQHRGYGERGELVQGITQGKRAVAVHPFRKGFQVREDAVEGDIGEAPPALATPPLNAGR